MWTLVLIENRPHRGKRSEDNAMIFYQRDKQILPSHHNSSFCVIAYARDVDLSRPITDTGSPRNVMHLSTLEVMCIPQDKIIEKPIEVLCSGNSASLTLGC